MNELLVPIEAPPEVSQLLFQAVRDGLITSEADARAVWKELVSVAAMRVLENMTRRNAKG